MKSLQFAAIVFFISIVNINAQNYISGRIIDEDTNEPLVGVQVFIKDLNIGTTTNEDGFFQLNNLKNNSYKIIFTYLGYAQVDKSVDVPSGESKNIFITMEETAINIKEIMVTGNPFLSETKDLSQTVISLSELDLIIKSGTTIGEELNFLPGISMRSNGIASGRPVIRGFSNNKVLILEDGLRMGDLSNSSDDHSVSGDGSEPEKIEVLKGPSSLLYGSNAIGGIVNVISDAIPSKVHQGINGEVLAQGASVNNEFLGNAHINYGIGNFAVHGKYFKRKGDDYSIPGGSTFNSNLDSYGSQLGVSLHHDWGMTGLSYTEYNNKYGLPTLPNDEEIVFIDMHKKQYRLATEVNNISSFVTSMSIKAGYLDYNHKEISKINGEIGTEFGLRTTSADISFTHIPFTINSQGIIGFYGLNQNYQVTGEEALTPNADYLNYAGYFFEKFDFGKIDLTFGSRFEVNNIKIPEAVLTDSLFKGDEFIYNTLSTSLGVVYNLNQTTSIFVNVANAFLAPTIEELSSYSIHEALASFDIGDRSLKKENTIGIDLGLKSQGENYFLELSGFYNKVNNLIYRRPSELFYSEDINSVNGEPIGFNTVGEGLKVYHYNQADAIVYGFESQLNIEIFQSITATFVADYVKAKNQTADENISQIPPFRFMIEMRHSTPKHWYGLTWNIIAAQNDVAPNETQTPGYNLVGIYGGIKFVTAQFAHIINLKIDNLFDQKYIDHLSAIKDFAFMPGRNIRLSYKFIF